MKSENNENNKSANAFLIFCVMSDNQQKYNSRSPLQIKVNASVSKGFCLIKTQMQKNRKLARCNYSDNIEV